MLHPTKTREIVFSRKHNFPDLEWVVIDSTHYIELFNSVNTWIIVIDYKAFQGDHRFTKHIDISSIKASQKVDVSSTKGSQQLDLVIQHRLHFLYYSNSVYFTTTPWRPHTSRWKSHRLSSISQTHRNLDLSAIIQLHHKQILQC